MLSAELRHHAFVVVPLNANELEVFFDAKLRCQVFVPAMDAP